MNVLRYIPLAFWLGAFLLSFTFFQPLQSELAVGAVIGSILACGSLFLYILGRDAWSIPREWSLFVLILFGLVAFLSVFWSQVPWNSYQGFMTFSLLPMSLLLFCSRGDYFDSLREKALYGVIISLIVFVCIGFYQYYFSQDSLFEGRVSWPLQNPNSLGALFSMGGFMSLGLFFKGRSRLVLISFVLCILGMVLTGSRGAFGAFILGLVPFLYFMKSYVEWKKASVIGAGVLVLSIAVTISGVRPDNMALLSSVHTVTGDHSFLWSRPDIWAATIHIIKENFWLGTGIGTFSQFYEQYRSPIDTSSGFMAHNDPLQFWAEMGVASFVLFYCFCGVFLARTWKAIHHKNCLLEHKAQILACLSALGAMVIHSHVSFNLHILPILMLSGLCVAIWISCLSSVFHTKDVPLTYFACRSVLMARTMVVIYVVFFVSLTIPMLMANYHTKKRSEYSHAQNVQLFSYHINESSRWSFGYNAVPYTLVAPLKMMMLEQDIDVLMSDEKEKRVKEIEALINQSEKMNPRAAGVFYNRAMLTQLLTKNSPEYGDADRYLEKALLYKPRHVSSRLWLADRYAVRGDLEKAIGIMEQGMLWCRRSPQARQCYEKLAGFLVQKGDFQAGARMLNEMRVRLGR